MVKAQEWLDRKHPKEIRSEVKEMYLNEPNLEGELDLRDFTYELHGLGVKIYLSSNLDESKLIWKNKPRKAEIINCVQAQTWLDQNYPLEGKCVRKEGNFNFSKVGRSEIFDWDISNQGLEGALDLTGFSNLQTLNCSNNFLTNLNWNILNAEELHVLFLQNNNFPEQNLSCFSRFTNLVILEISNSKERINHGIYNRFYGSLEPLKNLKQSIYLDIFNTNIDSGLEYLSDEVKIDYQENRETEINMKSKLLFDDLALCGTYYDEGGGEVYNLKVWKELYRLRTTNKLLQTENLQLKQKNNQLQSDKDHLTIELSEIESEKQLLEKKLQLSNLINHLLAKGTKKEKIDNLLETQELLTNLENTATNLRSISLANKQLERNKLILLEEITNTELNTLCQLQKEIIQLAEQEEYQAYQMQVDY